VDFRGNKIFIIFKKLGEVKNFSQAWNKRVMGIYLRKKSRWRIKEKYLRMKSLGVICLKS
jgi:hypothetical protein